MGRGGPTAAIFEPRRTSARRHYGSGEVEGGRRRDRGEATAVRSGCPGTT
jgi:hypothetical protein